MNKWLVTDVKGTNPLTYKRRMHWPSDCPFVFTSSRFCNTTLDGNVVWSITLSAAVCYRSRKLAFFSLSVLRRHRETMVASLKDRLFGKVDSLDEWVSILAAKRINMGALGDATPRG